MTDKIPKDEIATYSSDRLIKAREAKGWTQQELADALSKHLGRTVIVSYVKGWDGGIKPSPDYLIALAQVLGRKMEWFYV